MTGQEILDLIVEKSNIYAGGATITLSEHGWGSEYNKTWKKIKPDVTKIYGASHKLKLDLGLKQAYYHDPKKYSSNVYGISYRKGRKTVTIRVEFTEILPEDELVERFSRDPWKFEIDCPMKVSDFINEDLELELGLDYKTKKIGELEKKIEETMVLLGKLIDEKERIEGTL